MKSNSMLFSGITLLLFNYSFYAQQVGIRELNRVTDLISRDKISTIKNAEGSQFYNENYFLVNSANFDNPFLARYNAYLDKIEIKDQGYIKPSKDIIIASSDGKENYVYVDYLAEDSEQLTGYLNTLVDKSKFNIYKREKIILEPEVKPVNSYDQYRAPRFKKMDLEFYYQINNELIVLFPKKKKDFEKIFIGKEEKIKIYLKENKTSFSDEDDLIRLSTFLNTLL
ncbi:hypothetical protein [Flavobacterium lacus]|uniref:Uncharacterized protein n=1 Tax=Flavobacterium lacus TaxID=1353778 RepID=A0A328WUQ4_9FLAO|nr:hypothetical protein [Flavobacterium lacus]RAR48177.1 hypothetical protein B0I10_106180 [Flavobacterium lacus]